MCGIAGFAGGGDRRVLEAMASTLVHRGPDEDGFFLDGDAGLAIRRLSIIDPEGGHQPLRSEDGRVAAVFNGEIYNHAELREELEGRGHVFSTRSDGEVLVHLYEEMGEALLERLNGMFGLAIWDARARRLLLARDRMGIKPLHYWLGGGNLVFGSEIRALLEHPAVPRSLDLRALDQYLTFEYVPAPRTIFEGIRKLPPAHYLLWEGGEIRVERYWSVEYRPERGISQAEWEERLLAELRASVRRRLMSDVPLGAFLSGGIDSSTVVALMSEVGPVSTFSMGFTEASFDESAPARRVAELFGTRHHEQVLSARRALELVPRLPEVLDEPLGDASLVPTWLLSQFARREVKVVLSGEGGDELLAGYPTYAAAHLAEALRAVPWPVLAAGRRLVERLPSSTRNWSLDFRLKRFLGRMDFEPEERNVLWVGSFSPAGKARLYGPTLRPCNGRGTFEPLEAVRRPDWDLTNRLLYLDLHFYLADDLLVKVDRASMAVSLEARVPFLDHHVVELLARVPPELKLKGMTTKHLLKQATRALLPRDIRLRPKKGFGIPVAEWLKGPLKGWMEDLLSPAEMERDGLFRSEHVRTLVEAHLAGRADHRKLLWTLAMFVQWRRAWLDRRT